MRPSPLEHYNSLAPVMPPNANKIILVDDVVTRGSSAIGAAWRIVEANPDAEVSLFAIARTVRDDDVKNFTDIVTGTITWHGGNSLTREP